MREEIIVISSFIVLSGLLALEVGIATPIAELVAGMVANKVVDFENTEVVKILANIGILTLMYVAGLEIDMDVLRQNAKSSLVVGSLSFIVPFGAVVILSRYVLGLGLLPSLLAATALSTTSIAVLYPTLLEGGIRCKERTEVLSAAMVTDILSMLALGFIFITWSLELLALVVGLFIFTYFFPSFGRRVFRYYRGNVAEFEFKMILLLLLVVAIFSETAGVESAIIAFLLGMVTSEVVVRHEDLQAKLKGITFGFFAPLFFFMVGFSIDFWVLLDNWVLLLAFLVVCFIAKYLGTYLGARRYLPEFAIPVSLLFNANLNLGVIAATLGLDSGIFDPEVYSAVIGAVILSSIIASFFYRKTLNTLCTPPEEGFTGGGALGGLFEKSKKIARIARTRFD